MVRDNGRIDARKLNGGTPPDNPQGGGYIDEGLCNDLRKARIELGTDGKVSDEFGSRSIRAGIIYGGDAIIIQRRTR